MPESTGRGCVFCGSKPLTNEHVWPQWIRAVQPDRGTAHYAKQLERAGEQIPDPTRWSGRDYDLQVRCTCAPCNTGWMSNLERAAKPFLSSMIVGNGRNLYRHGQSVIAAWAVKTAMMFQCRDRDDPIPASHHAELFERREAPQDTQVWLGAFSGRGLNLHRHITFELDRPGHPTAKGYGSTFTVGHVVFQVFGHEIWRGGESPTHRDAHPHAHRNLALRTRANPLATAHPTRPQRP